MKILIFFLVIGFSSAYSQSDFVKWGKIELSYVKADIHKKRDYSFESESAGEFFVKSLTNAYWFFISDVDGDNCPFRPSCSAFMIESVRETNIAQASLMFFDRFTRDMNIFKGKHNYPLVKSGYYFDSPDNYTLDPEKIYYLPPGIVIND